MTTVEFILLIIAYTILAITLFLELLCYVAGNYVDILGRLQYLVASSLGISALLSMLLITSFQDVSILSFLFQQNRNFSFVKNDQ